MSALEFREVTVTFGGNTAVDRVSFAVGDTESVAIVGPNGAGKSTLLNALNGIVPVASGSIDVFGSTITGRPARDRVAHGVTRSFQHPQLVDADTVLQNLMTGAHHGLRYGALAQVFQPLRVRRLERASEAECRELLAAAGLSSVADDPVAGLPFGKRKFVDILRAFVGSPRIVLLDEPTSGIGQQERGAFMELLRSFRARSGAALVIVEHHFDVVAAVADRVVVLTAGAVVADAHVDDVRLWNPEDSVTGGAKP